MSYVVSTICSDRNLGGSSRKQLIMFLADKASDDGSGIWCSKGTIARLTGLGRTTVKRIIGSFLAEGLLLVTGKRKNSNGYTVEYRIVLERIEALPSVYPVAIEGGAIADPVHDDPSRQSTLPPPRRSTTDPKPPFNHPTTSIARTRSGGGRTRC